MTLDGIYSAGSIEEIADAISPLQTNLRKYEKNVRW